jgi:hypothetical protein
MSVEQDLLNDILSVKNAVVNNLTEINANAIQIEALVKDGFSWLEDNLEKEAKNLKTDLTNVEQDLKKIEKSSTLKQDLTSAVSTLGLDMDTVIKKLDGLDDLGSVIDTILDEISKNDNLPAEIKSAMALIKNIINAILGGGFSIAVKDLPAHTSPGSSGSGGSGGDTGSTSAAQGSDFLTTLLSGLGTHFDGFIDNNETEIKTMIANMETVITDNDVTAMEGPINTMVSNLKALSAGDITVEAVMSQLETLADSEKEAVETVLTSFFNTMSGDFVSMQTKLSDLLTDAVKDKGELHELYHDITGNDDVPSLLKIISIFISIPITLISNVSECKFQIPITAFPSAPKSGNSLTTIDASEVASPPFTENDKLKMDASLEIVKTIYLCVGELIDYQMDKRGLPVPYQYKFISGAIEAVFSILEQVASYPLYSGISINNASWVANWVTSFSFFLSKSMVDAYETKKIEDLKAPSSLNSTKNKILPDYYTFLKKFTLIYKPFVNEYKKISKQIRKVDDSYNSIPNIPLCSIPLGNLEGLETNITGITNEADLSSCLNTIQDIAIMTGAIDEITASLNAYKIKHTGDAVLNKDISSAISMFWYYKNKLTSTVADALQKLKIKAGTISLSHDFEKAKKNKEKLLGAIYPGVGLFIQVLNRIWTVYLYDQKGKNDPQTLIYDLINGFQFVGGNISSIYYYNNPPEEGSPAEAHKTRVGYTLFGTTIVLNIYSASTKLIKAGSSH